MDCESDESERWEDLFGSSIDISHPLIAYYDRLSSSVDDTNSVRSLKCSTKLYEPNTTHDKYPLLDTNRSCIRVANVGVNVKYKKTIPPPLPTSPPPKLNPSLNRRRVPNFCPSANVKRLIAHSETLHPDAMNENQTIDTSDLNREKNHSIAFHVVTSTDVGRIKLPLSKITSKLKDFANDLVIDDSDGGYVTPPETPYSCNSDNIYDIVNANINNADPEDENDKTPVNESADFDYENIENDNQIINIDNDVYDEVEFDHKQNCDTNGNNNNDINDETTIPLINLNSIHIDENEGVSVQPSENVAQSSPTVSHKSIDSETKSTENQLIEIENETEIIEYSTNPTILTNSSDAENETVPSNVANQKDSKLLVNTKIRPLSSVSISSTSSSSSSASDEHSSNQNAISYLASVESLADHSENELAVPSTNLTVTERACLEIIDSERSYVCDLGQVIRGYLKNWQQREHLEQEKLDTLFGNIEAVYEFSAKLLLDLEQSGTEPVKIAKCFIRQQDEFHAYTHYCTSYPEAISLLTTMLQTSHTNALLTTTQKNLQHTLPLGSYLLKPVQRILKYHLLLDNLRKHCHVEEVVQAHEIMKNVAQHIDQVKRHLEQQSRVRELSGILDGWLGPALIVLGDLVLEGILTENGKPRTVLLFETMLIITKKKEDNRLQFKASIMCKSLMLIEHLPGDPESFSVIPYNDPHPNQIKLTARNCNQKRKWAQHIKQVMLAHFDIPNRAKELLFQLGEEEDRKVDKNTWRWNSVSSTKPEYLERRNQYRRSEMRNRSKKQRKMFGSSLSTVEDHFDSPTVENGKSKVINSIVKELQQRKNSNKQSEDSESIHSLALSTDLESKNDNDNDDLSIGNNYEIPFDANKALPSKPASALDKAKSKLLEVRAYNTKTLPKRIANLKKQRSKTLKVTSKFYTDLPENESNDTDTVLKITENTDDLSISEVRINHRRASLDATDCMSKTMDENRKLSLTPISLNQKYSENQSKRDTDIISDLLKDHKEFDRILKKPPKKNSENEKPALNHEIWNSKFVKGESIIRTPLPPIPVEANEPLKTDIYQDLPPEPIYESLLRNVHVPYKFPSPVLFRSLSQPNNRFLKVKRPTEAPPKRPDSDYVTLTYDDSIEESGVDEDLHLPKHGLHFRKSDTNINYHVKCEKVQSVESVASFSTGNEGLRRSASIENENNALGMQTTMSTDLLSQEPTSQENGTDLYKSTDFLHANKTVNKLPERRVSDVTGMHRQSIIHKQGSKALGSRIASVDYVDPKVLFSINSSQASLTSKSFVQGLAQMQRDSAFSLTSSNDSVNLAASQDIVAKVPEESSKPTIIYSNQMKSHHAVPALSVCKALPSHSSSSSSSADDNDSYYEKTVESYLENDGIFRDSAIYSDENTEKQYVRREHIYSTIDEIKQEEKMKPVIPPKLNFSKTQQRSSVIIRTAPPPPSPGPPSSPAPPPPLPAKPAFVAPVLPPKVGKNCEQTLEKLMATPLPPLPPSPKASRIHSLKSTEVTDSSSRSSMSDIDTKNESIITKKLKSLEDIPRHQVEKPKEAAIIPPPIPARNFANKNSSWVMKQIQNFDK